MADEEGTVKIWDNNGNLINNLEGHEDSVTDVQFSSNNKMVASASIDGTVNLWSLEGNEVKLITSLDHEDWVTGVSFSPSSKTIASASVDGTVRLWDIKGTLIKKIGAHEEGVFKCRV